MHHHISDQNSAATLSPLLLSTINITPISLVEVIQKQRLKLLAAGRLALVLKYHLHLLANNTA